MQRCQYTSMWEPPKMPEEKQRQIANYKFHLDVPFRREDNQVEVIERPARRTAPPGKAHVPTVAPYLQGFQPGPPLPATKDSANPNTAPTSLWSLPEEKKAPLPFESSGDPVLDSLR